MPFLMINQQEIWNVALEELRRSLPSAVFDPAIKNIHIHKTDDGVLTLVPASVFDYWRVRDYSKEIEKALFNAAGSSVEFRIEETVDTMEPASSETSAENGVAESKSQEFSAQQAAVHAKETQEAAARPARIDSRYTLENFVVSPQNELAFSAAMNVAINPKESAYNPIFLYGPTGVGKTHLMHAVANKIFDDRQQKGLPPYKIVYVTSEAFTNDFLNTVMREKNSLEFHRRYREADILLVDDIQFFAGKEQTQEAFFHTFNELIARRSQIILTSDRPANDITGLQDRLVSRFQSGLSVDIQPPSLETRLAILRQKADDRGFNYAAFPGALEFVAENISHSVRDLEGAVNILAMFVSVRKPATLPRERIEELLQSLIIKNHTSRVSVENIQKRVAEYYEVAVEKLNMRDRTAKVAFARQVAMYLCCALTDMTLVAIGEAFGKRDHGTVIHARKTIQDQMDVKAETKRDVEYLRQQLSQ